MYFKAGASAEGGIDEGHENKAIHTYVYNSEETFLK